MSSNKLHISIVPKQIQIVVRRTVFQVHPKTCLSNVGYLEDWPFQHLPTPPPIDWQNFPGQPQHCGQGDDRSVVLPPFRMPLCCSLLTTASRRLTAERRQECSVRETSNGEQLVPNVKQQITHFNSSQTNPNSGSKNCFPSSSKNLFIKYNITNPALTRMRIHSV